MYTVYCVHVLPAPHYILNIACLIIITNFYVAECAHLLLAHNAPVKVKNAQGWSPLAEAISYGDRQMSKQCFRNTDRCAEVVCKLTRELSITWEYLNIESCGKACSCPP